MDPAVLGTRLASSVLSPLVKQLVTRDGPGAGLVDRPVRLSGLVSFRGEKRTLGEKDVQRLADRLVREALDSPGETPFPADEQLLVTATLARRLLALGDLDMDDVQAVRLGHRELARALRREAPAPGLTADAAYFLDSVTAWACLHILHFFTQRSTFVARTLVEQSRSQAELIAKVDALIARTPPRDAQDTAFEVRYRAHLAQRHNRVTIFGLDLHDSPDVWPLDVAYLSLEATRSAAGAGMDSMGGEPADPRETTTVRVDAEDAFDGHERVLLRGEAGSGKTTLIQWLAITATDRIPYVLPLRTLIRASGLPSPAAFLNSADCPHTPPDGWAERVLTAGRGLVMVDGLDEVPSADRPRVRDWLLGLVRAFPGNRWLLTARPTAVRPQWLAGDGFAELTLAPMERRTVDAFVRRWHKAADAPEHEEPLLDALRTKPDLSQLATNPLMCGLICALHRARRGYLPPRRKALYDAALQMILTERDRQRGMGGLDGIELDTEDQTELLQRLAYSLVLAGRSEMDESTALTLLERALPSVPDAARQGDARTILRHLLLRSGVLRSPAPQVVDFAHRTFLDHLAARYAVEEGHLDVLLGHADDTQWEDVVRMAVAHARTRERTTLLRGLLAEDSPRLTLLALASLQDASAVEQEVQEEVKERAASLIPPRTQQEAAQLAQAGPFVLELLPGPDGLTDEEALGVVTTASLAGHEGSLPVLKRYRSHPSLNVRRQLVGTWRRFDAQEYVDDVLAHVERDELDLTVRSKEQLQAMRTMTPWARVDLDGAYPLNTFMDALDPQDAQNLVLRNNPHVTDLRQLQALPALEFLSLMYCPEIRDLTPLSSMRLRHLSVIQLPSLPALTGLNRLTSLSSLSVIQPIPGDSLAAALPVGAPLEQLILADGATDITGLSTLTEFPRLTHLSLGNGLAPLGPHDWRALATHPALTSLSLEGALLPPDGPPTELPGVHVFTMHLKTGAENVAPFAPAVPAATTVRIYGAEDAELAPDEFYAGLFPQAEVTVHRWDS
ncbi:NACHT domain-containing protein [Streptomyces sp. NPDC046821]|uniref:NACHT domain-containing protein n=1 Tax=Streptomyces sp. NPDC046821 TaxID=3154702 RepID=UPI00340559D5